MERGAMTLSRRKFSAEFKLRSVLGSSEAWRSLLQTLPPLSEPGGPISGTGLSSGIMRLAHGFPVAANGGYQADWCDFAR